MLNLCLRIYSTLTKDIHTEIRDLTLSLKEEKVQRDEKEAGKLIDCY